MPAMIRGSLFAAAWLAVAGCSFSGAEGDEPGGGGGDPVGGGGGGGGGNVKPEPPRCKFTYVDVCGLTAAPALTYATSTILDTSVDATCPHLIDQGEGRPELCVFFAQSIKVAAGATVRAIGTRPIAFVSSGAISIEGTLTASSSRARQNSPEVVGAGGGAVACTDWVEEPDDNANGGGGGAGASCSGKGGDGGKGNSNAGAGKPPAAMPATELTYVRGGCRGQTGGTDDDSPENGTPGPGGPPGGGLYLAASGELTIAATTGRVVANGGGGKGGGVLTGGGGGGSGGVIILEGKAVHRLGSLIANCGGGGQGGFMFRFNAGSPVNRIDGNDGADGELDGSAARGGNATLTFGTGGDSSETTQRNGRNGAGGAANLGAGGGGGGGAAGFIRILGPSDGTGTLSPPLSN
jgi:hypothetical protein